jgi:hypothetical protein
MSEYSMVAVASRPLSSVSPISDSRLIGLYTATMLLSAALLFGVQPMFARMCLPLLGGSTSVWAIAMCFFQAALLAGYAYAHISNRFLSPSGAIITHVALIYAAFNFMPITPPASIGNVGGAGAGLALLLAFTKTIGLPFFVLSATAPLLQGWFIRTGHPQSANPYVLYAASNIGSIGALAAYPFLIEPLTGLSTQANAWHWGFLILAFGIICCGYTQLRAATPLTQQGKSSAAPVTWSMRGYWILMSFIPSGLLVAWTNRITSDMASAPFLWLPPLALYLLTFVLTFRDKAVIPVDKARFYLLLFLPLAYGVPTGFSSSLVLALLAIGAIAFFMITMICHRLLYDSRPTASRLTEFYMLISLGGVLGGAFVSLLAPVIFNSIAEYPLLMIAGVLVGSNLYHPDVTARLKKNRYLLFCCVAFLLAAWGFASSQLGYRNPNAFEIVLLSLIAACLFTAGRFWQALSITAAAALLLLQNAPQKLLSLRNYYGVITVMDTPNSGNRVFGHGTTIHGAERMIDINPFDKEKPLALTYYSPRGGMSRSIRATQDALRLKGETGNYGIIGLGVGSMACYREANDRLTFFEIDPDITAIAKNPQYFTYLSKCAPDAPIIDGDARLSLQSTAKKSYDYLLVDAFSSDMIPTHLLTREALQLYMSRMRDDGMLVLHLSNRFMDLVPFVQATAQSLGEPLHMRLMNHRPMAGEQSATQSIVLVISRSKERIAFMPPAEDMIELKPIEDLPTPWTDDYANIPAAIMRSVLK